MTIQPNDVNHCIKQLKLDDVIDLNGPLFESLLGEAMKIAPTLVRMIGTPDSADRIASALLSSGSLKIAVANIQRGANDASVKMAASSSHARNIG